MRLPRLLTRLPVIALLAAVGTAAAPAAPAASGQIAAPVERPCAPLEVSHGVSVDGFLSDRYQWSDAACAPRSAALVHNDVQDPAGRWGGYLRQYVYDVDGAPRVVNG